MMSDPIEIAAERLRRAEKVFVLTGAGISAESGVPTFRGAGGMWKNFRAEDLASPEGFRRDPAMVWEWYNERRRNLLNVHPNPGHVALATLERSVREFLIATQNVDGLHQEAGSERIETIHGDIWATRCLGCGREEIERGCIRDSFPPRCGECGGMLRPAIVWFGEMLPMAPLERIDSFLRSAPPPDVVLLVGTTAIFPYIQAWALSGQGMGALLVEVNPEETVMSPHVDVRLAGPSGEILPRLVADASRD